MEEHPDQLCLGRYDVAGLGNLQPNHTDKWWLIRTKGRQEQALAIDLACREIAYFLPMLTTKAERSLPLVSPMFSGYMFLYGTVHDRYKALTTNRIVQIIEPEAQSQLYWDLQRVNAVVSSGLELRVISRLCKGDICTVMDGPMKGQYGVIESASDDNLWIGVWIKVLGQSVLFKWPRIRVELLKDAPDGAGTEDNFTFN